MYQEHGTHHSVSCPRAATLFQLEHFLEYPPLKISSYFFFCLFYENCCYHKMLEQHHLNLYHSKELQLCLACLGLFEASQPQHYRQLCVPWNIFNLSWFYAVHYKIFRKLAFCHSTPVVSLSILTKISLNISKILVAEQNLPLNTTRLFKKHSSFCHYLLIPERSIMH